MHTDYQVEIRVLDNGDIDTRYYAQQAQSLRNDEFKRMYKDLLKWVKGLKPKFGRLPAGETVYSR